MAQEAPRLHQSTRGSGRKLIRLAKTARARSKTRNRQTPPSTAAAAPLWAPSVPPPDGPLPFVGGLHVADRVVLVVLVPAEEELVGRAGLAHGGPDVVAELADVLDAHRLLRLRVDDPEVRLAVHDLEVRDQRVGDDLKSVADEEPAEREHPRDPHRVRPDRLHPAEVRLRRDDRRRRDREEEGDHQRGRGAAAEEPAAGAGGEDRDDVGDAEVEEHGRLRLPVGGLAVLEEYAPEVVGVVGLVPGPEGGDEEEDARRDGREAEDGADEEHLAQVPRLWVAGGLDVVSRDREHARVVDERDEDDREHGEAEVLLIRVGEVVRGIEEDRDEEEEDQLDGAGDSVDAVVADALEDLAAHDHGVDDDAEPGLGQDDVGRGPRSVRGAFDSDPDLGLLERRGVVDTVAGHPDDLPGGLEDLNDLVLVFGEDLRKSVGRDDDVLQVGRGHRLVREDRLVGRRGPLHRLGAAAALRLLLRLW
mmetsp:Transcript_33175/g.80582  ORF Transcript_33175/g.80582 Transcript_33175/m.80582 type:complete len:476 (+) Transcript_33175:145-1572(+)